MKSLKLALILVTCCGALVLTTGSGCNTAPENVIYKTEGVIIVTVDAGMQTWADYVNAGNATQAQVDTIKAAYNQYYDAQQSAKAALKAYLAAKTGDKTWLDAANQAVAESQASLLRLLNSFITNK